MNRYYVQQKLWLLLRYNDIRRVRAYSSKACVLLLLCDFEKACKGYYVRMLFAIGPIRD